MATAAASTDADAVPLEECDTQQILDRLGQLHKPPPEFVMVTIREQEIEGDYFVKITKEELECVLSSLRALTFCKYRDELVKGERKRRVEVQRPRKFLQEVGENGDFRYQSGLIFLGGETGASSISQRTREFKEMSGCSDVEEMKEKFVKELTRFSVACLNARQNGTLYFGVRDNRKESNHLHGEIVGVHLEEENHYLVQEWMDEHFRAKDAAAFRCVETVTRAAARRCIKGPHIIPIKEDPERAVIEVDIYPTFETTKYIVFYSKTKKKGEALYYIREGTNSQRAKDIEQLNEDVQRAAAERKEQEGQQKTHPKTQLNNFRRALCSGSSVINEGLNVYGIVLDNYTAEDDFKQLTWISRFKWLFIMDFSSNDDCFNRLKEEFSFEPNLMSYSDAKKFLEDSANPSDFRRRTEHGSRILWLKCHNQNLNLPHWNVQAKTIIRDVLRNLTDPTAFDPDSSKVTFLFLVKDDKLLGYLGSLIKESLAFLENSSRLLCVLQSEELRKNLYLKIDDHFEDEKWRKSSFCIQLKALSELMLEIKPTRSTDGGWEMRIPCSYGLNGVAMPENMIEKFKARGIEILAMNEEDKITVNSPKELMEANQILKSFYQGPSLAPWEVFSLTDLKTNGLMPGAVERTHTKNLMQDIETFVGKTAVCNDIETIRVIHQHGSGATTMARSLMWKLRKKMRCVYVNGDYVENAGREGQVEKRMKNTAELILYINKFEEKDLSVCVPVLVVLDNTSDDRAELLLRCLNTALDRGKTKDSGLKIVLLYLCANANIQVARRGNEDIVMEHQLTQDEENDFTTCLKEITASLEEKKERLNTVLSFVVLANFNKPRDDFVRKIVTDSLEGIEAYPAHARLLLYLAIFKLYAADVRLPDSACFNVIKKAKVSEKSTLDVIAYQVRFLIRSPTITGDERHHGGGYICIEVSHSVVARHLLNLLGKDTMLSEHLVQLLKETKLLNSPYLHTEVTRAINALLLKRTQVADVDSEEGNERRKPLFAPCICKVLEETDGFKKAVNVLQTAYEALGDVRIKSGMAQGIARLHLEKKAFDEAKKWATTSIELSIDYRPLDTMGHIYRREVESMMHQNQNPSPSKMRDIFSGASKAVEYYQRCRRAWSNQVKPGDDSRQQVRIIDGFVENCAPAICGEIKTNQMFLDVFIGWEPFRLEQSTKNALLLTLKKENNKATPKDLIDVLDDEKAVWMTSFWHDFNHLVPNLYHKTKADLAQLCRMKARMEVPIRDLSKLSKKFFDYFGEDLMKIELQHIVQSEEQDCKKVTILKSYLLELEVHNFEWALDNTIDTLLLWQAIIVEIEKLLQTTNQHPDFELMRSYVTVYYALICRSNSDETTITLTYDRVVEFVNAMMKQEDDEEEKRSDDRHLPDYLIMTLYLLTFWPGVDASVNNRIDEKLFKKCMGFLYEFFRHHHVLGTREKFLFTICCGEGRRRYRRGPDDEREMFHGQRDKETITYTPPGFTDAIKLPICPEKSLSRPRVRFTVNFTRFGPVGTIVGERSSSSPFS